MGAKRKTRNTTPSEVFLSHASVDRAFAGRLADELRRHRVPVWYSERSIGGAQQWLDEIGAALRRCDWFIVVLTPAAVRSKWVKRELTYALREDQYDQHVVPLLVKDCNYEDLAWPLSTVQIIPFKRFADGCQNLLRVWGIGYRR
jgi:hypothetical protein